MNLYQFLRDESCEAFDLPFLTAPEGPSLTYRQVDQRSAAFAGALTCAGASSGDRVVVQVEKSSDAVALYFACLRRGLVYVPINTAYTDDEVHYFVDDAQAAIFVCDPARELALTKTLQRSADTVVARPPRILTLNVDETGSLPDLTKTCEPDNSMAESADSDIAAMLYTSGTTGRSKGAMLTHLGLRANAIALHQTWAFEPGDVLLHSLPIFHVHGLFVALHCAILNGSEVLFCQRFDVEVVTAQLRRATVFMGVPTHYVRLLNHADFDRELCQSVRLFTSGSAPMTELVFAEFEQRSGHKICERYGMTECGIITSNPYAGQRLAGTVGNALPGYEVRVRNESGIAPVGDVGIVEVRGDHLFAGYWQMPEKTAEEMTDDGFFKTGDVGFVDESGRVTLAGRSGDMIISGGFNVYPKEIESVLDALDGVLETAVVGLPHHDFGEAVTAFVVLDTANVIAGEDLSAACQEPLARFKHPKQYIVLDELPRNTMGKVQKVSLRNEYRELYARQT